MVYLCFCVFELFFDIGEVVGSKGTAEKAGQRDCNLNSRQKPCWLAGEFNNAASTLVTLGCQLFHFAVVTGNHGDFRTGKYSVECDQDDL